MKISSSHFCPPELKGKNGHAWSQKKEWVLNALCLSLRSKGLQLHSLLYFYSMYSQVDLNFEQFLKCYSYQSSSFSQCECIVCLIGPNSGQYRITGWVTALLVHVHYSIYKTDEGTFTRLVSFRTRRPCTELWDSRTSWRLENSFTLSCTLLSRLTVYTAESKLTSQVTVLKHSW